MAEKLLLNTLEKEVLAVIKEWSESNASGFDGIWKGYNTLYDEVEERGCDVSCVGIKMIVKRLYRANYIKLEPLYNDEFQLAGSGYFYRGECEKV